MVAVALPSSASATFRMDSTTRWWSRFDATVRDRVQLRYLESIASFRHGPGYRIPAEYLLVLAERPPG